MGLFTKENRLRIAILLYGAYAVSAIFYQMNPILDEGTPSGWDTSSHFYLTKRMLQYLREFRLDGYNPYWNCGYPEFVLYPPLAHLLLAMVHIITFGAWELISVFRTVLFSLPFLFLLTMSWASARIFGGLTYGLVGLIMGTFIIFSPVDFSSAGIGLASLTYVGLLPAFIAQILYLGFLVGLVNLERKWSFRRALLPIALLALIALCHSLTLIFSLVTLLVFALFTTGRGWLSRGIIIFAASALLSAFWTIPFFSHLWLSSSESPGIDIKLADPAFAVYGYRWYRGFSVYDVFKASSLSWQLPFLQTKLTVPLFLLNLPFQAVLLLTFSTLGIIKLLKSGKLFLPVLFVSTFIFLPRNALNEVFPTGLHSTRFVANILTVNGLLATYGLGHAFKDIQQLFFLPRVITRVVLVSFVVIASVCAHLFQFRGYGTIFHWDGPGSPTQFKAQLERYPLHSEAMRMIDTICSLKPSGRVAIEETLISAGHLGTPHFFSFKLPESCQVATIPGLLAESSVITPFVMPTLAARSLHFPWGESPLFEDRAFMWQSPNSMIKRLALFDVEYVLSTSPKYFSNLKTRAKRKIRLIARVGPFALFKLLRRSQRVTSVRYAPFLFVDRGGESFRDFSQIWFKDPELFEHKVIYHPPNEILSTDERNGLGGVIASFPKGSAAVDCLKLSEGLAPDLPLIILNAKACKSQDPSRPVFLINNLSSNSGELALKKVLLASRPVSKEKIGPIALQKNVDEIIVRASGGTVLNYAYAPGWNVMSGHEKVFMVTPAMIFVFSNGELKLNYR